MTSKFLTLAATVLSVVWLCAAPAMPAHTADAAPAAAIVTDPARLAIEDEIITNLHLVDILTHGARQSLLEDKTIAAWPQADRTRFTATLDAALVRHWTAMTRGFAAANLDQLTMDQVNDLLTLSKITYVQQRLLAHTNPTLHPDASALTAEERATIDTIGKADYATHFLGTLAPGAAMDELRAALEETLDQF